MRQAAAVERREFLVRLEEVVASFREGKMWMTTVAELARVITHIPRRPKLAATGQQ
jgi:hypothetical protein